MKKLIKSIILGVAVSTAVAPAASADEVFIRAGSILCSSVQSAHRQLDAGWTPNAVAGCFYTGVDTVGSKFRCTWADGCVYRIRGRTYYAFSSFIR